MKGAIQRLGAPQNQRLRKNDKKITRAWTYCARHESMTDVFNITSTQRDRHRHRERTLIEVHYVSKTVMTWGETVPDRQKGQCGEPNEAAQHSYDPPPRGEAL